MKAYFSGILKPTCPPVVEWPCNGVRCHFISVFPPSPSLPQVQPLFSCLPLDLFSAVCLVVIAPLPASSPPWFTGSWTLIPSSASREREKKQEKAQTVLSFYSHSALNHVPSSVCLLLLHLGRCHPYSRAILCWMGRPSCLPWPRWSHQALFPEWGEALGIFRLSKVGVKRKKNNNSCSCCEPESYLLTIWLYSSIW